MMPNILAFSFLMHRSCCYLPLTTRQYRTALRPSADNEHVTRPSPSAALLGASGRLTGNTGTPLRRYRALFRQFASHRRQGVSAADARPDAVTNSVSISSRILSSAVAADPAVSAMFLVSCMMSVYHWLVPVQKSTPRKSS